VRRHHRREACGKHQRSSEVGLGRDVVRVACVERQSRASHAQRVNWRRLGRGADHLERALGENPLRGDRRHQRFQLGTPRQGAPPKKVRGLLEGHAAGQILDGVPADDELSGEPVDVAQPGLRGDDALEPPRRR
jgi:hypothetical protein